MVKVLAQATRVPPLPLRRVIHIPLLGIRDQNLSMFCQARHVHETLRPVAHASSHEIAIFQAYVASLALCVLRARLDRGRDGLRVLFVRVVLLRAADTLDQFTGMFVSAALVLLLAFQIAVARFTPLAMGALLGQGSCTGGTGRHDVDVHL